MKCGWKACKYCKVHDDHNLYGTCTCKEEVYLLHIDDNDQDIQLLDHQGNEYSEGLVCNRFEWGY